jgi:hypothetical protein
MPCRLCGRIGGLAAIAMAALCVLSCAAPNPYAEGPWPALQTLAEKYGLQILWDSPTYPIDSRYGTIDGAIPPQQLVTDYVPVLTAEINRYPVDLLQTTKLHRIVLSHKLTFNGRAVNGLADFKPNTLYLDVERLADEPEQMRKCIHHEFFHILDYMNWTLTSDDEWERLNPAGFTYRGGSRFARAHLRASLTDDSRPGFVNLYATSTAEEDKAELFAFMMVRYNLLKERARGDKVLHAKITHLKKVVAGFSQEMDDAFWE